MSEVIVIGGGAAGLMAAVTAKKNGHAVTVLEKNQKIGRKLFITGKGRCNVTNNCSNEDFIKNVIVNGRFLYSAINAFSTADTMAFFEDLGVPLKTERGNRVFPVSDKSADIVDAFYRAIKKCNIKVLTEKVSDLIIENGQAVGVVCENRSIRGDAVILATGGKSYPLTGSTGDGYVFAQKAGHTITELSPSLVPIETVEKWGTDLSGLTLKNVAIKLYDNILQKVVYTDFGELLFTHFGLSGPMILSLSSHIRKVEKDRYVILLDLKPALTDKQLDMRLLREFDEFKNNEIKTVLKKLLPSNMVQPFCDLCGINADTKVNEITKEQRKQIIDNLKCVKFNVKAFRPIEEAVVTSGGVKVSEISPKTMESKLVKGLYFAGEIIDVDAYTGGFNLQIAFSTGYLAGNSIY